MSTGPRTGAWARVRRAAAELSPAAIEQIALRVAELLGREEPGQGQGGPRRLLDAGELAGRLGVSREWIYEHANELGAVQLGDGPKPRLRFDPKVAGRALEARRRRAPSDASPAQPASLSVRPRRRAPTAAPLLPVYEPGTRRILARARSIFSRRGAC